MENIDKKVNIENNLNGDFSIKEAFSFAWNFFKKDYKFLLSFTLISAIVLFLVDIFDGINIIINTFAGLFVTYSFIRIGLGAVEQKKIYLKDIFDVDWKVFGMFFVGSLIFAITYIIGFALLIIPAVIVSVRLAFFAFSVIDKKMGPMESIADSYIITKGKFWHLLWFFVCVMILNAIGSFLLFVGLLITAPITVIATAFVYNSLKIKLPSTNIVNVLPSVE